MMKTKRLVIALTLALAGLIAVNTAQAYQYWSSSSGTGNWLDSIWSANGSTACSTYAWGNGGNVDARISCSSYRNINQTITLTGDTTIGSITGYITGSGLGITINGPGRSFSPPPAMRVLCARPNNYPQLRAGGQFAVRWLF